MFTVRMYLANTICVVFMPVASFFFNFFFFLVLAACEYVSKQISWKCFCRHSVSKWQDIFECMILESDAWIRCIYRIPAIFSENSICASYQKVMFYCERPGTSGGGTGVCPSNIVLERLTAKYPDFIEKLEEKGCSIDELSCFWRISTRMEFVYDFGLQGFHVLFMLLTGVKYTAYLRADADPNKGVGRGWKQFFGKVVETKDEVEKRMVLMCYVVRLFVWLRDIPHAIPPLLSGGAWLHLGVARWWRASKSNNAQVIGYSCCMCLCTHTSITPLDIH